MLRLFKKTKELFLEYITFFIFGFLILISISFLLIAPATIEKKFYPEKYWRGRVKDLEQIIENDKTLIRDTQIDIQKMIVTMPLEVARYNDAESQKSIQETQLLLIEDEKKVLKSLIQSLEETQGELLRAKEEWKNVKEK